jgi:mRNA interferase HigB
MLSPPVRTLGSTATLPHMAAIRDQSRTIAIRFVAGYRRPRRMEASGGREGGLPKASILKAGRVVFNIKGNDYRLIARVQYEAGVLAIRFFGTHAEYDKTDAETV